MPAVSEHFEHVDSDELAQFGYKQELDRSLGSFSSFAAGFSYISILTGVFQLFGFAFLSAGPAFWWTWPMVFIGQMLVALCFAELAGQYPARGLGLPVVEADRRRRSPRGRPAGCCSSARSSPWPRSPSPTR